MRETDLEALLAELDQAASAVRLTLSLIASKARAQPPRRKPDVLRKALKLDAARRASTNGRAPARKASTHPRGAHTSKVKQQRAHTAALLRKLSTNEPRKFGLKAAGILVRRGYIKRVEPGLYLRTEKPFQAWPVPKEP